MKKITVDRKGKEIAQNGKGPERGDERNTICYLLKLIHIVDIIITQTRNYGCLSLREVKQFHSNAYQF